MTEATGIHDHPTLKLGRRPKDPSKPRLRMARLLNSTIPDTPGEADHFTNVSDWGLYRNDAFGVCGPTSVANSRKLVTKYLTDAEFSPTQDDVFDLYRRSGNPNFDPATGADDNGVILQDMLSEVVKNGIGGCKAVAFAEVDHTNLDELFQAIAIFGSLILGVDLEDAQKSQTPRHVWDYNNTPDWGGHAILGGQYVTGGAKRLGVITWAEVVAMTEMFMSHQLDEAWIVVWPEHFRSVQFMTGVDVGLLAAAFRQLTGRTLVVPPVPTPVPTPPTPAPQPSTNTYQITLEGQVSDRVRTAAARAHLDPDAWVDHHYRKYFRIS